MTTREARRAMRNGDTVCTESGRAAQGRIVREIVAYDGGAKFVVLDDKTGNEASAYAREISHTGTYAF